MTQYEDMPHDEHIGTGTQDGMQDPKDTMLG